jgi:hypothetical protein
MMETTMQTSNEMSFGLSDLHRVPLLEKQEEGLQRLQQAALGTAEWRARKQSEARDLLALERIAERMQVLALDTTTMLRALIRLWAAVPCMPPGARDLVVEDRVDLVLLYPEEILRGPLPGYALVEIMVPRHVYHANVATRGLSQRLCLGAKVPRGYPLREAVPASYAALTLQSVMLDELDPAGVMNGEAARWWQANTGRIPLTTTPFLAPLRAGKSGGRSRP